MEYIAQDIWLSFEDLETLGQVGFDAFRQGILRNRQGKTTSWVHIENPRDKREKWVAYESLPMATKERLPNKEALLKAYSDKVSLDQLAGKAKNALVAEAQQEMSCRTLSDAVKTDLLHMEYLLSEGFTEAKSRQMCRLAGWLQFAANLSPKQAREHGFESKAACLEAICKNLVLEHRAGLIPPTRPIRNVAVLARKTREWKDAGIRCVISGKVGNSNRTIFKPEHQALVRSWYAQSNKPTMWDVYQEFKWHYINTLKEEPSKLPSYGTVKKFLGSSETQHAVAKYRHGEHNYNDKLRPTMHRKRPEFSHFLVAGDGIVFGETVKIPAGHPFLNPKSPAFKTGCEGSLVCWVWYDVLSEAIVGFRFGFSETADMIRLSFRQILKLHDGRVPMSVHLDRGWSKNKEIAELFYKAGVSVEKKRPFNKNDSIAEVFNRFLGRIHKNFSERWINRTNHKMNFIRLGDEVPKALNPLHVDEAMEMFTSFLAYYNEEPLEKFDGQCRAEIHATAIHPECQQISLLDRTFLFGSRREVKVDRGIVRIQVNKIVHEFMIADWGRVAAMLPRTNMVRVVYDEDQMDTTVDLYLMADVNDISQDRYLTTCEPLERYEMARFAQTQDDLDKREKQLTMRKGYDAHQEALIKTDRGFVDENELLANLPKYGQARLKAYTQGERAQAMQRIAKEEYEAQKDLAGTRRRPEKQKLVPVEVNRETNGLEHDLWDL